MALMLEKAEVRDFSGGWNVADTDSNLSSKFQPLTDNINRGSDGSMTVRWGHRLFADGGKGVETDLSGSVSITTSSGNSYLEFDITGHGLSNGSHVTVSGFTTYNGIQQDEVNATHGILVVDANNFRIPLRTNASGTGTTSQTLTITADTHAIGGNLLHIKYFNRFIVAFDDIGEVNKIAADGTITRIWDYSLADTLTSGLMPTRECTLVNTATWKSTLISVNGYDKDKPLQIDENLDVEFLVDKATSSNSAVPRADFVISLLGYVCMIRTEYGDTFIEISAKGTDGTFTRETVPDDSVEIDLAGLTETVDPVLLGATKLRDKLFVTFYDQAMIGTLGIYDGSAHDPDFSDTISEHGTVASKSIYSHGNEIFMADYAGVPSVQISAASGVIVPSRVSALISNEMQKHFANISENTMLKEAFAVYNRKDRQYMLFVPKYEDNTIINAENDPFYFTDELRALNRCIMRVRNHKLMYNTRITIAGAANVGSLTASNINGDRTVIAIIDDDTIIVELGDAPVQSNISNGGGNSATISPINDEMICYAYDFNKDLSIRRWTRFRDLPFKCGTISQRGRTFFGVGKKIYRWGDADDQIFADYVGDYDNHEWNTSTAYTVGTRVLDTDTGTVYKCLVEHTSAGAGTFEADRAASPDNWEEYRGEPIDWEVETPWSDMKRPGIRKDIKFVKHDTNGSDRFTFSIFSRKQYRDPATGSLAPTATLDFVAGDTKGFGAGRAQGFGTGRRTDYEKLWPMPAQGHTHKLRYSGSTYDKVQIVSTTLFYVRGNENP
jgi:hypothetical protein